MAIFKPPQGTTAERGNVVLEKGELMFDTTNNTFYTGNDTAGGKAITETTITIASTEMIASGSNAAFEETVESTPQARIYNFKYPSGGSAGTSVIPAVCVSVETAAGTCTARPVAIAADGTATWSGAAVGGLIYNWSAPVENS